MNYLIHIFLLVMCLYIVGRKQPDQWIFYLTAVLKIIAGLTLGLIYLNYYKEGDTIRYWEAGAELARLSFRDWQYALLQSDIGHFTDQPRAILFSKIVSGLIVLTKGDYWIVSTYFSTISFLAYWYFYRQIRTTLPNLKWPVVIGFLLLPSTLFWSAGLMKGALTNPAVVFLSAFTLKLFFRKKVYLLEIIASGMAIILLYLIKYYLLIILLPVVLYILFDRWSFKVGIHTWIRGGVYTVIIASTLVFAPSLNPNLNISELPEIIHRNQQTFGTDKTIPTVIQPNWNSLVRAIPQSLFIGLFGPTLLDSGKIFGLVPRVENLFVISLFLWSCLLLYQKRLFSPDILVVGTALFILTLAVTLPLAAPNYGALVRYRAPFTPFLMTLVLILPTWWMQKKLNR